MKARIIFNSGATLDIDVEELTTERNPLTNELTSVKWTTAENWTTKLHTITLDQVAAIALVREPEAGQP